MCRFALCLVLFLSYWGGPALAAPKPADRQVAKQLFQRGKKHYVRGHYRKSIQAFLKAYHHWRHPAVQYNIALAYARLGEPVPTIRHLRRYLRAVPKAQRLPELLRRMQRQVGVLVVQVPDPRATIYVDGKLMGHDRIEWVARPRLITVQIRLNERVMESRAIRLEAGQETVWHLTGWHGGAVPRWSALGGRSGQRAPGSEAARSPRWRRLHWVWFATAGSIAFAAAVGATAMSVKTRETYEAYREDRTNQILVDQGTRYQLTANILWGVTAASATAAVLLAVFTRWKRHPEDRTLALTPLLGPGALGVHVRLTH